LAKNTFWTKFRNLANQKRQKPDILTKMSLFRVTFPESDPP